MSLAQYLIDLVKTKMEIPRGEGTEDAVSDLAERVNAGEISVKEAAQLGTGLLIAGHETTANMIGIGVLALLENPEQAALLRDSDDPKFIANAVEELMRYLSIIQNGQRRVATEDIEIGGETIRAGEGIILDLAPANWDAAAYPDPDKLDLTRDAGQQLGFGYGRHQCVGQQLARAELQIVFQTLLAHPHAAPRRAARRGALQARPPCVRRLRTSRYLVICLKPDWRNDVKSTTTLYPAGGYGAPKDRQGHADKQDVGLPAGTEVFSADDHISVAEDIFYERFPDKLKEQAPRIWYEDGAYMVGRKGQNFLPGDFSRVLMQYDELAGAATNNIEARIQELAEDGVDKELAFPNAVLALFHYPDKELRERVFRIYNEYMADLQERSNGHFYGAGLINWWDPGGCWRTVEELKSLGLKTFLMPINPGKDDDGNVIDYGSTAMSAVWDEIEESGLPVTHHIGETPPKTPCEFNSVVVGMMINIDGFREVFSKYIFSGILDRHPKLRIGWFEGGIAWVPWALQDAEHLLASYQHMFNHQLEHDIQYYWDTHMSASFMIDPLGLQLIDRIGVDRVFWSSDYPHNESTFGYSEKSLAPVVEAVGPDDAAKIVSGNIKKFLGIDG